MTPTPDVVIVGSGPVGLANACLLKCLNKELNIVVVDKRPDTTRRHGLHIDKETVKKMNAVLETKLKENPEHEAEIKDLKKLFKSWGGNVVRTNDIEDDLKSKAELLGVKVLRSNEFEINADTLNKHVYDENDEFIKDYMDNAKVIIGADGSHSAVRKAVMHDEKEQEKNLSYLIEFKYQTSSETRKRNNWEALKLSLKTGSADFETMGRGKENEPTKPATLHVSVNERTYNQFRPTNEKGEPTKGTFQTSWSEDEIRLAAETDPQIAKVLKTYDAYKKDVEKRGGRCEELKISTIPMNVYRSKKVAAKHQNRFVLLCGDASSGVVFGRGVNKGFQEAAISAVKVDQYFKDEANGTNDSKAFPKSLKSYEKQQAKLFKSEKGIATFRARSIRTSKVAFSAIANLRKFFRDCFENAFPPEKYSSKSYERRFNEFINFFYPTNE